VISSRVSQMPPVQYMELYLANCKIKIQFNQTVVVVVAVVIDDR
jgi:hypothetical protein